MTLRALAAALIATLLTTGMAHATPLVVDRAQALDPRSVAQLTEQLQDIQTTTGVRVRLVFARTLNDELASDMAQEFLDPEGGEQAILLFAMADRQVRLERSEALRERISERVWTTMLAHEVLPELKAVRHGAAARAGVDGIEAVLEGRYGARPVIARGDPAGLRDVGVVVMVAALLALGLLPRSRARIVSRGDW